jgi:hypothetical protein
MRTFLTETVRAVFAVLNTIVAGVLLFLAGLGLGGLLDTGYWYDRMLGAAFLLGAMIPLATLIALLVAHHGSHIFRRLAYAANTVAIAAGICIGLANPGWPLIFALAFPIANIATVAVTGRADAGISRGAPPVTVRTV